MTWTYTDPTANDRDEVRFLIGDTDTSDQQLSDEEIAYFTSTYSDNILAAAYAAEALASKYGRRTDIGMGKLRVSYGALKAHYAELAASLFSRCRATVLVGGISISEKETLCEDTDAVQGSFRRGMHDNPGDSDSPIYDPDV